MSERTANLIGGACGVASIVLFVIGLGFLVGIVPPVGGSGEEVSTFLGRSGPRVWTGAYLGLVAACSTSSSSAGSTACFAGRRAGRAGSR